MEHDLISLNATTFPEPLNPEGGNGLVRHAASSVKWTFMAGLLPRSISPISALILAAILMPADFGTVAVSSLVIALAQVIVGLGLGPAVVQRRTLIAEAATVSFWISLTVASVVYALLWFSAPWLAHLYRIPLVADVVRVSGVSLFLFAVGAIPSALLQRGLEFRKIFWVESLSQVTGVIISLVLAIWGAGVWALVIGPLSGAAIRSGIAWAFSGWYPSLSINRAVIGPLTGFGLWMTGSGFLSWMFLYADNAIAGIFLGGAGLGVYSMGFNISNLLPGVLIPALSAVAYPAFCTLQSDRKEVGQRLLQLQSLTVAVLFPLSFGISAVAVPAVALLYGARWQGLGEVIQMLAILPGAAHLWSLNADAYRAIGRPDLWVKLSGLNILVFIPLLLLAGPYGLVVFTLARLAGASLYPILNIVMGGPVLGISTKDQLQVLARPLGCAAMMYISVTLLVKSLAPFEGGVGWLKLFAVVAVGAGVYLAALRTTDRLLWSRLLLGVHQTFEKT